MISKSDNTTTFINDLDKFNQTVQKQNPAWLKKVRKEGLSHFEERGFPTVKDEEWKYTNISSVTKKTYNIFDENQTIDTEKFYHYVDKNEINIVFINGKFSAEHSTLKKIPKGVTLQTLQEATIKEDATLKGILNKFKVKEKTSFVGLNNAFSLNGTLLKIEPNTVIKDPIHIIHVTSPKVENFLNSPHSVIVLGKSAEATVLESHLCFSHESTYLSNALTDISLEENAVLHYIKAQNESTHACHIGSTRVWQERNSNFQGFSLMTGASITRNNLDIVLNGEGSNGTLNGLYLIGGHQLADNHTTVDHLVPNCTSNQLYKGILKGAAHAVFNGKIYVRDIAQQTNSYQLNKNLIMGEDCRVDTKPQLEIFADDVKCTHGATIGQLNQDELFYLQTRSIPKRDAIRMLSRGFVDDLLDSIQSESIRQKLNIFIEPQLSAL